MSLKTIDIKGKPYVQVSTRIQAFNEKYPNGYIQTSYFHDGELWIVEAKVCPDCKTPERIFIGHAQEIEGSSFINKTSALENCETSAVGRALGLLGIGIEEGFATADEVVKAQNRTSFDSKSKLTIESDFNAKTQIKALEGATWNYTKKLWTVFDTIENRKALKDIQGIHGVTDENGTLVELETEEEVKQKDLKVKEITKDLLPF